MEQNNIINEVGTINWDIMSPIDIVTKLEGMARSKGYAVIKDHLSTGKISEIKENPELYKLFQEIKRECKASFDYDCRLATILEVNTGLTNIYSIILKLLKASNSDMMDKFNQICQSVNIIEEKLEMILTVWDWSTEDARNSDVEIIQDGNKSTE